MLRLRSLTEMKGCDMALPAATSSASSSPLWHGGTEVGSAASVDAGRAVSEGALGLCWPQAATNSAAMPTTSAHAFILSPPSTPYGSCDELTRQAAQPQRAAAMRALRRRQS